MSRNKERISAIFETFDFVNEHSHQCPSVGEESYWIVEDLSAEVDRLEGLEEFLVQALKCGAVSVIESATVPGSYYADFGAMRLAITKNMYYTIKELEKNKK